MRGHQHVIALRRRGVRPSAVWIDLDHPLCDWEARWPTWTQRASVSIEPSDSVQLLDLRFLVGLQVHVMGSNVERCRAVHQRCMEAGARRVITTAHAGKHCSAVLMLVDGRTEFEAEAA